jgi:hypothetical protein
VGYIPDRADGREKNGGAIRSNRDAPLPNQAGSSAGAVRRAGVDIRILERNVVIHGNTDQMRPGFEADIVIGPSVVPQERFESTCVQPCLPPILITRQNPAIMEKSHVMFNTQKKRGRPARRVRIPIADLVLKIRLGERC